MRIMFITPQRNCGGAERIMTMFAGLLASRGHKVFFVQYAFSDDDYAITSDVEVIGLPNYNIREKAITAIPHHAWQLRKIIKKRKPDVLIPFLAYTQIEAFLALPFTGSKLITAIRNNPAQSPVRRSERWIRNIIAAMSSAVFAQTETQKQYFPEFIRRKTFVVPNPISDDFINKQWCLHSGHRVVTFGRLNQQKNHAMLIAAIHEVNKVFPDVTLHIFGDGPERSDLQRKIDSLQMNDYAVLEGRTANVIDEYLKANVAVLPSNFEGFPNALMEGMAIGVPSISTDCPTGPAELIDDGINGLLVPMGDYKKMAAAIVRIFSFDSLADEIGKNGKKTIVHRFSQETIVIKLECELKKLIK